jgi:hypothetical protein
MLVSDVIIAWNPNQKWSELLTPSISAKRHAKQIGRFSETPPTRSVRCEQSCSDEEKRICRDLSAHRPTD